MFKAFVGIADTEGLESFIPEGEIPVERLTRVAPDVIDYTIMLDDATTWTRPWTAVIHLRRTNDKMYEFACHEGSSEVVRGVLAGARSEERAAEAAKTPK